MPKYVKKKYSKKRYRKSKKKFSRKNKLSSLRLRGVSLMPDTLFLKLKYEQVTQGATAVTNTHRYALNGLFDPDLTGGGHHPLGFDQWMNFYEAYEIHASKISVRILNQGLVMANAAVYPANNATVLTNYSTASEQPYSVRRSIGSSDGGHNIVTLNNYMNMEKFEGRNTDSVNYVGNVTSNPGITREWHLMISSSDVASNLNVAFNTKIVYYVKLFRRQNLAQSTDDV